MFSNSAIDRNIRECHKRSEIGNLLEIKCSQVTERGELQIWMYFESGKELTYISTSSKKITVEKHGTRDGKSVTCDHWDMAKKISNSGVQEEIADIISVILQDYPKIMLGMFKYLEDFSKRYNISLHVNF